MSDNLDRAPSRTYSRFVGSHHGGLVVREERIERLARRLARSESQIYRSNRGARAPESAFDGVAGALAAPVPRRRAVVTISGAVLAGSLLRPRRARAAAATCECPHCWPYGPKPCQNSKGAKVCVEDNLQCCSNDNCAIA